MLAIKRNGATVAIVEPDGASVQEKDISGMDAVRLSFALPHYVRFLPGDRATVHGEDYHLTTPPTVRKEQGRHYAYRLEMEGERHKLGRALYRQANAIGLYYGNPFHLNADARTMMQLLVANVDRCHPGEGWKLGQVEETGIKNVRFDGSNCLEAANLIAGAFDTEWHVSGRTVHLLRRRIASGLVLRQGEALYSLEQKPADNRGPVTRLYAYGSEKNLPANYRNGRRRLSIGAVPYIEAAADAPGIWEADWTDDDIFPSSTGTVAEVDPADPLRFRDPAALDPTQHLAPGLSAKAAFQTGQLAGYSMEIQSFANGWFKLKKHAGETSLDIPSALFRPAVGDEYFLHDLRMPDSYVEAAEERLAQAAAAHLRELGGGDGLSYAIV